MKPSRLSGRKANTYLRKEGHIWRGRTMTIRYLHRPPYGKKDGCYVGTSASLKLHRSAVKRNRMRRRCKEALRIALKSRATLPTIQLLISPKIASLDCDYKDIQNDIENFMKNKL